MYKNKIDLCVREREKYTYTHAHTKQISKTRRCEWVTTAGGQDTDTQHNKNRSIRTSSIRIGSIRQNKTRRKNGAGHTILRKKKQSKKKGNQSNQISEGMEMRIVFFLSFFPFSLSLLGLPFMRFLCVFCSVAAVLLPSSFFMYIYFHSIKLLEGHIALLEGCPRFGACAMLCVCFFGRGVVYA